MEADKQVADDRILICKVCPHLTQDQQGNDKCSILVCSGWGCLLDKYCKVQENQCPISKW